MRGLVPRRTHAVWASIHKEPKHHMFALPIRFGKCRLHESMGGLRTLVKQGNWVTAKALSRSVYVQIALTKYGKPIRPFDIIFPSYLSSTFGLVLFGHKQNSWALHLQKRSIDVVLAVNSQFSSLPRVLSPSKNSWVSGHVIRIDISYGPRMQGRKRCVFGVV